ncbi:MAG: glycosyltransferase, partial [Myxococcales bacterium]
IGLAAFNAVRSRGRSRLGLSSGLRGNGMCLSIDALRAVPYRATSLVEDIEYGLHLGEAGIRVEYAPEARVSSDVPAFSREAEAERRRWEDGRRSLVSRAPRLFALCARRRDAMLLDLAADLLIPPLSTLVGAAAIGFAASLALGFQVAAALHGLSVVLLAVYVARGWVLSGTGLRGLAALAYAPIYLAWKLGLALAPHRACAWDGASRVPRAA